MRPGTLGAATLGLAMPPSISQKNSPAEGTEGCARRTFTQGLGSAVPCVQGGGRRGCVRPAVHSLGSKERHAIPPSAPQPQVSRPRPIRGAFPAASALFLACLQCSFPRSSRLGLSAAFPPPRLESSLAEGGDLPPPLSREGPVPAVPGAVRAGPKYFPSPFPLCTPSIRTPACLSCRKKMKKKIQNI